jgi:hypothetical protein
MNVHISCTPEFSVDKLDEIIDLLNSIPGELTFKRGELLDQEQFSTINNKFVDLDNLEVLGFDEFLDLVQSYRVINKKKINENEFVILISTIRNDKNWFSAFKKKNIFIHGEEWDLISDVDSKFAIAYQCVGNIFHSLMDLKTEDFHMKSIGCIDDFCGYKPDILLKMQSANICPSCLQRSVEKGINSYMMSHFISILEEIRKEFVISKRFFQQTNLEKVKVDEKCKITIGSKIIVLEPLPKTMYICFLKNIDGILSNKKCENKHLFQEIYDIVKTQNPDKYAIQNMCCNQVEFSDGPLRNIPTFETNRNKIRTELTKKLGTTLANHYSVNKSEGKDRLSLFKIPLREDQLILAPKFR